MGDVKKYEAQKRHLAEKKQLRVWMDANKFEMFKKAAEEKGQSIYSVINRFVDEYLNDKNNI